MNKKEIVAYAVAVVAVIFGVAMFLNRGDTKITVSEGNVAECKAKADDEHYGFEIANMNTGRAFVLADGTAYYWPKSNVSGLEGRKDIVIPAGEIRGVGEELRFSGFQIGEKDIVNAAQLSFGLKYSGENIILIHANGTVTWINILNSRAKLTNLDGYNDIVSAAPSINGDGVPVITLISRDGKQNHLLLNYLNSLKAQ
jgi:hypothetical protein